jgi:hypothetical protein
MFDFLFFSKFTNCPSWNCVLNQIDIKQIQYDNQFPFRVSHEHVSNEEIYVSSLNRSMLKLKDLKDLKYHHSTVFSD